MIIISVYNNEKILKAGLLSSDPSVKSLNEIKLVDNTKFQFKSMGQAILSSTQQFNEDEILIMCHQDVVFYNAVSFSKISSYVKEIEQNGLFLAGVAGVRKDLDAKEGIGFNNIVSGGRVLDYLPIDNPEPVDVLDECVIITNKRAICKLKFFQDDVFDWHLYAADACLAATQAGIKPYVFPIDINHLGVGKIDKHYFDLSLELLKKYEVDSLCSTMGILTSRIIYLRRTKLLISDCIQKAWIPIKNVVKFGSLK